MLLTITDPSEGLIKITIEVKKLLLYNILYILAVRLRVNCGNSLCMFESSRM